MKTILTGASILFLFAAGFTACSTAGKATPNTNTATNSNSVPANTANSAPANTATPSAVSLATPTEAYKTAYAMRKNGDVEGLKKVMSKDVLEFLTDIGKEEKRTLDDQIKEMIKTPQGPTDDVRNEKISGDKATIEYLKKKDEWTTMDFVKEGGDWKLTLPRADSEGGPKPPQ